MQICTSTETPAVKYSITVTPDFCWKLLLFKKEIPLSPLFQTIPPAITTVANLQFLLSVLQNSSICVGNQDDKFTELITEREGKFLSTTGSTTAQACKPTCRQ